MDTTSIDYEAHYRPALEAIAALDGDHASTENGVGFSRADGEFGHALVSQSYPWTPRQIVAAYKILRRYGRTQLPQLGFDISAMPEPPAVEQIERARVVEQSSEPARATVDGRSIVFSWGFDRYFRERVDAIKQLPGRKFDSASKSWIVPITPASSPLILATLDDFASIGHGFIESDGLRFALSTASERASVALEQSRAESSEIEIRGLLDNDALRPFQRAGVEYAIANKKTIIADDMGLGKTLEAIATMTTTDRQRVLIVCPASLKTNWAREIVQWVGNESIVTLEGKTPGTIERARWTIINFDVLSAWAVTLSHHAFDAVIVDEAHYLKSGRKSQRGKAFELIIKAIKPEYLIMLTGTPMLNRPVELFPIIRAIGGELIVGGWNHYIRRYCDVQYSQFGMDVSGSSNLDELNVTLRSGGLMLRRRKADVLKELPPRLWATVPMVMSTKTTKTYDTIADEALRSGEEGAILKMIGDLRQLTAEAKLAYAVNWIAEFLETGEQLVVFAWHRDIALAIAMHFDAPVIIGGMKRDAIEYGKDRFQRGDARVIVCNIAAGGVGHTLTAASNVLFIESAWNGALMDQALDRCHRMGQAADSVTGWIITAERASGDVETIDHYMADMVTNKRNVTSAGVDGRDVQTQRSMISRMLGQLRDADDRDMEEGTV